MNLLKRTCRHAALLLAVAGLVALQAAQAPEALAAKKEFKVAWTIYVGWMPWDYADKQGIIDKWARKYGIKIDVVQVNDYIESINQYTAGKFDAGAMTNMDALTIPAAGGVDSTAVIINDFSNGNDGIVLKGKGHKLADIKGQTVNLVELSVSHYLLARALESAHLAEKDLKVLNTSDADIVAAYGTPGVTAVVTWNPQLSQIRAIDNASMVFDSSAIPGEIIDMMVFNTQVLKENPAFGKALTGAWYEVMGIMSRDDAQGKAAREFMAKSSGTDLKGYESQLATTRMFYKPAEAVAFATSAKLPKTMDYVRQFSFSHGILGNAKTVDDVGLAFPKGKTLGKKSNLKLRFDATYMELAAHGKL